MRLTAKLEEYDYDRKFGFLRHPDFPKQKIMVHKNDVDSGFLKQGDELEFTVIEGPNGLKAIEVRNIGDKVSQKIGGLSGVKVVAQTKHTPPPSLAPHLASVHEIRTSPILKENPIHLYMPWNPGYINDQMFQLKNLLSENGRAWIPKIDSTEGKAPFNPVILEILHKQIESGIETCLFMTNYQCIHIWKIAKIHFEPELPADEKQATLSDYEKRGHTAEFWMQVTDVYVLQADHDGRLTPILQELEKLSICDLVKFEYDTKTKVTPYMSAQRYPAPVIQKNRINYFANVIKTEFAGENNIKTGETPWLNTHRKVTREYTLMQEHLKKNLYPRIWETFNLRSQHFLIELEMLKIESAGYSTLQSLQFSKQMFECYISAILNELDEIVGEKIRKITNGSNITEITYKKGTSVHDSLKTFRGQGTGEDSADLPFYRWVFQCKLWRNSIQNLKLKANKSINHEDIEYILRVVQSDIPKKLINLNDLRNWYAHEYFEVISQFPHEGKAKQNELISKVTTILNLISSPHRVENIFNNFYEIKANITSEDGNKELDYKISDIKQYLKKTA